MEKIKVMTVFGTRPEAIKMAPLVLELNKHRSVLAPMALIDYHRTEQADERTEYDVLQSVSFPVLPDEVFTE